MKKNFIFLAALAIACSANVSAQQYVENFDSNSLEWTECTFDNKENIKTVIAKGVLTVHSEKNTNFFSGATTLSTAISTCYAPIDVKKPFKITTHLNYSDDNYPCGVMFNLKDEGTYYAIVLKEDAKKILFQRWENNQLVGGYTQGFPFPKLKKGQFYELVLESNGNTISFTMQGIPVFKLRYMPLTYSGFGYLTYGDQEMIVDDVIFEQNK